MAQTGAASRPLLEDGADSAMDWARANALRLAIGVGVVAAGVVGWLIYGNSRSKNELNAEQSLFGARQAYESGNYPLAQSELEKLIRAYGGTDAADHGRLVLAQAMIAQGKLDSARTVLNDEVSDRTVGAAAEAMLGAILERENKPADAATRYQAAAQKAPEGSVRDGYRADAARALAKAGNTADAVKIWEELARDPDSFYAAEARVRMGELTAKPAGS